MNLADLTTELGARGFDYLTEARRTYFLNQAYLTDICETEEWPFLEATATGNAPLTIADLRVIESVVDENQQIKLTPLTRKAITDLSPDLDQAGNPESYYITSGNTVNTWPNAANSLTVRYHKVPTELSSPTDTPLLPSRWQYLIVEGAVKRAYEDDDEYAAAQAADALFQVRLQAMRDSLLHQQHDRPSSFILQTDIEPAG